MSYDNYFIKLNDGREDIIIPANLINVYPIIQDQIIDLVGNELALAYADGQALRIVLTTDFLKQGYGPDMYIRLINAMSYLGNDDIVNIMLKTIVNWFDTPNILLQLKQNKEAVKNLMGTLAVPVLWQILQFFQVLRMAYEIDFNGRGVIIVASNDLNYIAVESEIDNDFVEIWYKNQKVSQLDYISDIGHVIKDNGDYYYLDTYEDSKKIIKLIGTEIIATRGKGVIPHPLWDINPNVLFSEISSDGTKYSLYITSPTDEYKVERYEIRNMDTNNLILTLSSTGNMQYYVSTRMNFVIETDGQQYYLIS